MVHNSFIVNGMPHFMVQHTGISHERQNLLPSHGLLTVDTDLFWTTSSRGYRVSISQNLFIGGKWKWIQSYARYPFPGIWMHLAYKCFQISHRQFIQRAQRRVVWHVNLGFTHIINPHIFGTGIRARVIVPRLEQLDNGIITLINDGLVRRRCHWRFNFRFSRCSLFFLYRCHFRMYIGLL